MPKREKTWTFMEIDQGRDVPKGTTFRAFKQLLPGFDEGQDFYYLSAVDDAEEIERLRASGRVYQTTVNAVLLLDGGYEAVIDYLADD